MHITQNTRLILIMKQFIEFDSRANYITQPIH